MACHGRPHIGHNRPTVVVSATRRSMARRWAVQGRRLASVWREEPLEDCAVDGAVIFWLPTVAGGPGRLVG